MKIFLYSDSQTNNVLNFLFKNVLEDFGLEIDCFGD